MERFKVFIKPSAVKEIKAIPHKKNRRLIAHKIKQLSINPRPQGSQKLSGHDRYRLRQGHYRIIYSVEDNELAVYVIKIGHRKEIYR